MSILHSLFSTIIIATIFIATTAAAANTGSDSDTKKVPNTNKKRNTSTIRNAKKSTSSTHPFHQKPSTRIVGGTYVQKPGTYPWFTQLLYYSYIYDEYKEVSCSGMLITPQFVLTAAHCITDTLKQEKINEGHNITNAAVRIGAFQSPYQQGDNGGQDVEFRTVKNIYVHPDYEYHTVDNDFALLHLSEASTIPVVQIDTEGLSDSFVTGKFKSHDDV
jgi:secreted trypsin-like serine protease